MTEYLQSSYNTISELEQQLAQVQQELKISSPRQAATAQSEQKQLEFIEPESEEIIRELEALIS